MAIGGGGVTLIVPELRVHNALVVDPELLAASIDYGFMRAADVVGGVDEQACRTSADIARTRMLLRETRGPLPGPFGHVAAATDGGPSPSPEELEDRLGALVAQRSNAGLPLPPGM